MDVYLPRATIIYFVAVVVDMIIPVSATATSVNVTPTNPTVGTGQKLCLSCETGSAVDRPAWNFKSSKPSSVEERIVRNCAVLKDGNFTNMYETRWSDSGRCVLIIKNTNSANNGTYTCANSDDIRSSSIVSVDGSGHLAPDYCAALGVLPVSFSVGTVYRQFLSQSEYISLLGSLLVQLFLFVLN